MRKIRALRRTLVVGIVLAVALSGVPAWAADGGAMAPQFASSALSDERGDVIPIAVTLSEGSSARVDILGRESDYEASVEIRDVNGDGLVTLEFNTYAAGTSEAFDTAADVDSVAIFEQSSRDRMLEPGYYRLRIPGSGDVADLTVEHRGTESVTPMVAPSDAHRSLTTEDAVTGARESGNLTARAGAPEAPVARGDTLVIRLKVRGFSGALAAQPGDNATEQFLSLLEEPGVSFSVVQANPTTEREPARLLLDQSGVDLVVDARKDAYFLVVDTESAHYRHGDGGEVLSGLPMGARFRANLTIDADSKLGDGTREVAGTGFRVVERSATVSTHEEAGRSFLAPAADQRVGGRTTLAPGSRVTVSLGAADGGVQRTRTVTVQRGDELGTFATTFNLRRVPENTTVAVTARVDGGLLTAEPLTATVRSPEATMKLGDLKTAPGVARLTVLTEFSRGGLVVVRAYNESGWIVGTEPVAPGKGMVAVTLRDLPPKDTPLIVTAVRDMDGDGRFTPDVDVAYTEMNSPRPLDRTILLYELPPSPTPTPTGGTTVPPDADPTPATATAPTTPATPTPGGSTDTGSPPTPDFADVSGFGLAAALVGLLGALAVLGRR